MRRRLRRELPLALIRMTLRQIAPCAIRMKDSLEVVSSKASANNPAESPPTQSTDGTDTSVKTKEGNSGASNDNLRYASYDWILKSTGLKGAHNIVWPDSSTSFPTPALTTGLNEMGLAMFNDDPQGRKQPLGLVILTSIASS